MRDLWWAPLFPGLNLVICLQMFPKRGSCHNIITNNNHMNKRFSESLVFIGFEMTNTLKSEMIKNRKNNLNLSKILKIHECQNINILVIYNNKSLNIFI